MIIQVIGADCMGKSTLINEIKRKHKVQHNVRPKPTDTRESVMQHYIDSINNAPADGLIFDRNWWCEYVYGNALRDHSLLTLEDCLYLNNLAKEKQGTIIIHCTDDPMKAYERLQKRGDDHIETYGQLKSLVVLYNKVMRHVENVKVLDYTIK